MDKRFSIISLGNYNASTIHDTNLKIVDIDAVEKKYLIVWKGGYNNTPHAFEYFSAIVYGDRYGTTASTYNPDYILLGKRLLYDRELIFSVSSNETLCISNIYGSGLAFILDM